MEIELGGIRLAAWGWDRRRFGVSAFFEMMTTRELTGEVGPPPPGLMRPAPLSKPDFDAAVRTALRQLTRAGGLSSSALLDSALLPPGTTDPATALGATIRRAIADLGDERGGAEHRRMLERTFLAGAPSQEAAAEVLGLPFSTYRRHLAGATDRLIDVLWGRELCSHEQEVDRN